MKHITIYSLMIVCFVFTSLLATSCNSDLNSNIKDDPYSGGKAPLGIGLLAESPSPESAYPNDTVVFKAKGMLNWCDPQSGRYDFKFYISDEETKIVTATDTTITVKIPGNLSSGTAYIVLKEQVFYGPRLTVLGNIRIDQSYGFKGTSGPIYDCAEHYSKARVYYPVGDYMQAYYNENSSQSFSCISMVLTDGSVSGKWVTDFKLDLFDVFEGRKVVVSDVTEANFPSFTKDKLTAKFIFSGAKDVTIGTDKYTFTVTANGTQLNASKNSATATKIATIDADGIITYNKADENAQALLNKSAYNVDPFTVGIEIVVTNECDEILPLTGNKFDVKFLRPINVVDLKSAELQDATTGTAKIDMSKLLGLTDWRGQAFAVAPIDFYTYYGVTGSAISIDKDQIMTTLNASEAAPKLLKDVAPNMSINYTCDLQKIGGDITYGDLVYANGKFTINAPFKLFIPVTVKYTFGEVTSTVTLTITPTHQ